MIESTSVDDGGSLTKFGTSTQGDWNFSSLFSFSLIDSILVKKNSAF